LKTLQTQLWLKKFDRFGLMFNWTNGWPTCLSRQRTSFEPNDHFCVQELNSNWIKEHQFDQIEFLLSLSQVKNAKLKWVEKVSTCLWDTNSQKLLVLWCCCSGNCERRCRVCEARHVQWDAVIIPEQMPPRYNLLSLSIFFLGAPRNRLYSTRTEGSLLRHKWMGLKSLIVKLPAKKCDKWLV